LLIHTAGRQRELAVRAALGASRRALIRLFLTQTILLTATGGTIGVWLSSLGVNLLIRMGSGLPRTDAIQMDGTGLAFALVTTLLVGICLGTIPVLRAGQNDLDQTLRMSGRADYRTASRPAVRIALTVSQVALIVILLIGAGLLARSFVRLMEVDLGF